MANTLGTLFIDLKANVADYVSGMGAAAYASKQAGRDIKDSFEGLGGILSEVLGPLGELGSVISETFSKVGSFAGDAAAKVGKLGGAIGLVGAGAGVAVGALAGIEAGAIALALHTAESAAKLGELSQITGVSTEALSGLGFAAKQSGVDQESMTKGLEKLNKAIFAAATAPAGAVNAFTRLGVSVKGADGQIRGTEDIFADLAGKFSGLEDGPTKGALAIQLFGKAGAELIPVLNQGRAGIEAFVATAQKLGIVIDQETAESAHKFEQTLNELKAAGEGVSLQLTKALLPAMQAVSSQLAEGLSEKGSGLDDLISGVKTISQYFISFGGLVAFVFKEAGAGAAEFVSELEIKFEGLVAEAKAAAKFDGKGVVAASQDTFLKIGAVQSQFLAKSRQNWADYNNLLTNAFKDSPDSVAAKPKGQTKVDLGSGEADKHLETIKAQIAALDLQAEASTRLAAATQLGTAAERIQTADNEAGAIIQKLYAEADKTAGAEKTKLIAYIQGETEAIKANTREKVVGADILKINQELQKETDGYAAQIAGLISVTDAYEHGSEAIAAAGIDKQLEKDREKVAQADAEYKAAFNTVGTGVDRLALLAKGLQQANADLETHAEQLEIIRGLQIDETIAKEAFAFQAELPAIDAVTDAYFRSAEAVRQAQIGLRVTQYKVDNPGASNSQLEAKTKLYRDQSDQAKETQIAQEAASFSLLTNYDNQIAKLADIKAALLDHEDSTILVDAAIYDANDKIVQQYDAAALKVGDFSEKTRALLNEVALDGKNLGSGIFSAFSTSIAGVEDQLAKLAVTGKANFKQLFTSLQEEIAKAGIKKIFSSVAGGIEKSLFGGSVPGLGAAKADGSTSSPWYVIPVDSSGNVLGDILGAKGGPNGDGFSASENAFLDGGSSGSGPGAGLSGLFSGLTSTMGSLFSGLVSSLGSIIGSVGHLLGGLGSGIGGLFGGFLAGGGDADPGKAYVVGEKRPEVFVPKQPGRVLSSFPTGGKAQMVTNHFAFYGVTDHDSFKKSETQMSAFFGRSIAIAQARG
jgi:lambda family phage tail tape measure protein